MADVKLRSFRFKNLNYSFDEGIHKGGKISHRMTVQLGTHKDPSLHRSAVRIRFQIVPEAPIFLLSGECEAHFDILDYSGTVTPQKVAELCWEPAYNEYRMRIEAILKKLGVMKTFPLPAMETLPIGVVGMEISQK